MNGLMFLILLLVAVGVGVLLAERYERKTIRNRFAMRKEMNDDDFFKYFSHLDADLAFIIKCREKVASSAEVSRFLIYPDDRFDGVLSPVKGMEYSNSISLMLNMTMREYVAKFRGVKPPIINSVQDFIRINISLERGKAG